MDQVLDEILVGPVPVGMNKFVLQADAPEIDKLPESDILGVTVILVTCSYKDREILRVGYYVNNEYTGEYDPEVGPPVGKALDVRLIQRQILSEKPRVTKFPISWGANDENTEQQQATTPGGGVEETKEQMMERTPTTDMDTSMEVNTSMEVVE